MAGQGWTADSTQVTADSTAFTADGGGLIVGPGGPDGTNPYLDLITSEHNQKPKFMAMVASVSGAFLNVRNSLSAIQAGFDLDVATGVQLDVIGLWVGQPRVVEDILVEGFFGFADDPAALTFGELSDVSVGGIFYNLGDTATGSTVLDDPAYRTIIKARIARNQSTGTLTDLENSLQFIFGAQASVVDNGNMTLTVNITTKITPTEQALLSTFDLLPRPAGVSVALTYAT